MTITKNLLFFRQISEQKQGLKSHSYVTSAFLTLRDLFLSLYESYRNQLDFFDSMNNDFLCKNPYNELRKHKSIYFSEIF